MLKLKEAVSKTDKTLRLMRCFEECTDSFSNNKPFPLAVCYQRSKLYLKLDDANSGNTPTSSTNSTNQTSSQESNVYLFDAPIDDLATFVAILNNFEYLNSNNVIDKHNIEYLVTNSAIRINSLGKWSLITKLKVYICL